MAFCVRLLAVLLVSYPASLPLTTADATTCPEVSPGYDGSCLTRVVYLNGTIVFGLLGHFHDPQPNGAWCDRIGTTQVETGAITRWLLGKLTEEQEIPGITFGYTMYDTCRQPGLVSRGVLSMVPELETPDCSVDHVTGIFAQTTSDGCAAISSYLRNTQIPVISSTATAPSLTDREQYPTFLRTIPPDTMAVQAIRDIVVELSMSYVAIVYTNDSYGRQGMEELSSLLRQASPPVCIATADAVMIDDSDSFQTASDNMLAALDKVGEQGILGVVYFGQYPEGVELVKTAGNLPNQRGRQFIWVMCEAVGLETELYAGHEDIGRNTISLSPVHYQEISDFSSNYWLPLLADFLSDRSGSLADPYYYRVYIEELLGCSFDDSSATSCYLMTRDDLDAAYVEPGYSVVTIDSVYAFVQAVKNIHSDFCVSPDTGLCEAMREELANNFLTYVKQVDFTYTTRAFSYVPSELTLDARRVSFDEFGSPQQYPSSASYDIHRFTCHDGDCTFVRVGDYSNGQLDIMGLGSTYFYPDPNSDEPLLASDLQPIICVASCTECHYTGEMPFAYIPGEFLVAAILPFHDPLPEFLACNESSFRERMVQSSEAILYAVDQFNDPDGTFTSQPLHGQLGVIIFNSCHDGIYASHRITDLHSGHITLVTADGHVIDPNKIVGYIGGHFSSTNIEVANLLGELSLTQLGYAATSVKLFEFPHFLRTIPADDVQAEVIIEVVKKMGWQEIDILYQDDAYGQAGYEALLHFASEARICVQQALAVPVLLEDSVITSLLPNLFAHSPDIGVAVLFMGYDEIHTLLSAVRANWPSKRFQWIGSEAWGQNDKFLEEATALEALGALTVSPQIPDYPSLQSYFSNLVPEVTPSDYITRDTLRNARNPYFDNWWEDHFNCHLINSPTAESGTELCAPDLTLEDFNTFNPVSRLALPAVLALAIGIGDALENKDICDGLIENCANIRTAESLQKIVDSVGSVALAREDTGIPTNVFTERRDGKLDYVVNNIQIEANNPGVYHYVEVGEYSQDNGLQLDPGDVIFYSPEEEVVEVTGICTENCDNCSTPDNGIMHATLDDNGTVAIFAILPMHASMLSNAVNVDSLKALEALLLAVENINEDNSLLSGIKIGYSIRDSFASVDIGSYYALTALSSMPSCFQTPLNSDNIISYLTTGPDNVTVSVFDVTQDHETLHVDTTASVSAVFPPLAAVDYFVPVSYSTATEADAIASGLAGLGVEFIGVIYSDDFLMADKYRELSRAANDHGLCITSSLLLSSSETADFTHGYLEAWLENSPSATIIVIITGADLAEFALRRLENFLATGDFRSDQPPFVFVGGVELSQAIGRLTGSVRTIVNNALTVTPQARTPSLLARNIISEFGTVPQRNSDDDTRNPWYTSDAWTQAMQHTAPDSYDEIVEAMVAAVYSLAQGLQNYLQVTSCITDYLTCLDHLRGDNEVSRLRFEVTKRFHSTSAYVQHLTLSIYKYGEDAEPLSNTTVGSYDITTGVFSFSRSELSSSLDASALQCPEESACRMCPTTAHSAPLAAWMIVLIAVCLILIVVLTILLVACCYRRRSKGKQSSENGSDLRGRRERTDPLPPRPPHLNDSSSASDRSHYQSTGHQLQYSQGVDIGNGQMELTPITKRAHLPGGTGGSSTLPKDPSVPSSIAEYYLGASSTYSGATGNEEIERFMFDRGSLHYENPKDERLKWEAMPAQWPSDPSLRLRTPYSGLGLSGDNDTLRKSSLSSQSIASLVIRDPALIQNILEGVKQSSPQLYEQCVRNGTPPSRFPLYGHPSAFTFDNRAFIPDQAPQATHARSTHSPSSDSGVHVENSQPHSQYPNPQMSTAEEFQGGNVPVLVIPANQLRDGHIIGVPNYPAATRVYNPAQYTFHDTTGRPGDRDHSPAQYPDQGTPRHPDQIEIRREPRSPDHTHGQSHVHQQDIPDVMLANPADPYPGVAHSNPGMRGTPSEDQPLVSQTTPPTKPPKPSMQPRSSPVVISERPATTGQLRRPVPHIPGETATVSSQQDASTTEESESSRDQSDQFIEVPYEDRGTHADEDNTEQIEYTSTV